jgi:hypothetical protein
MRIPKPPKTEIERRDAYLKGAYGIGIDGYNQRFEEQNRACGVCKEPPKEGKNLHVDHDHKWKYFKLETEKQPDKQWTSRLAEQQEEFCAKAYRNGYVGIGKTKSQAIKAMRQELKRLSVRGLLCFKCNTSIRKLYDNAIIAENIAIYLKKHQY